MNGIEEIYHAANEWLTNRASDDWMDDTENSLYQFVVFYQMSNCLETDIERRARIKEEK